MGPHGTHGLSQASLRRLSTALSWLSGYSGKEAIFMKMQRIGNIHIGEML